MHTKNSQEVIRVLERLTGLPILIQVAIRNKLCRHLMKEGLPLDKKVSQSSGGNCWNKVLVFCEGIIKGYHHVWGRCMQPALYSYIHHLHTIGNLGFSPSLPQFPYMKVRVVFLIPLDEQIKFTHKCQVL